jgi:hypothetical protein
VSQQGTSFLDFVGGTLFELGTAVKNRELRDINSDISPNVPGQIPSDQRIVPNVQGEPGGSKGAPIEISKGMLVTAGIAGSVALVVILFSKVLD